MPSTRDRKPPGTGLAELQGLRVMVTRPRRQADELSRLIIAAGGHPLMVPTIEVTAAQDLAPTTALLQRLAEFHLAIFISANAVEWALPLIDAHGGMPPELRLAAVGHKTAQTLARRGCSVQIQAAAPYNSEALLATPELHAVKDQRVVIFRGESGRELLAETLRARGARVEYAAVYRRSRPLGGIATFLPSDGDIDVIVVTSREGLDNLLDMVDDTRRVWLLRKPLVVIGTRIADAARRLGFLHAPMVAREASDEALLAALQEWAHQDTTRLKPALPLAGEDD